MVNVTAISTYTKTLVLIIVSSLSFILLFAFLYFTTYKEEKELYASSINQFNNEVNSLLLLNSETHISTITDVTYWDAMVRFTKVKNAKWFEESVGKTIDVYKMDRLEIFDLNGNSLAKASTAKIKTEAIISKEVFPQLYNAKLLKYYIRIPEGIAEVFAATIHPSDDPYKTKTSPSGYFFMVRVLDKDYFRNLEKITSSEIKFTEKSVPNSVKDDSVIVTVFLRDWDGSKVANMQFKRYFNLNFASSKRILYIIFGAFIINFIISLLYFRKWIYKPLLLITRTLETGNTRAIAMLRKLPGEFGYIGNLFYENNTQRLMLEKAKRKAEESEKLKAAFLTNLSHEIRTPMNAIIGFADLLKNEELSESERQEYIKVINQSGSNLVLIIDDLIEMSKIDANQITPNFSSTNLDACLTELYDYIKVTIPKNKDIDFRLTGQKGQLKQNILTDPVKLKQIITNLLTNAIKFTDNGSVSFGYEMDEGNKNLVFTVADTGLGIDEHNHRMIFERFKRVENDYSIKVGGLGLGLAISKAYVEMLGGIITLEKSVLGEGSVFSFTIPLKYATDSIEEISPLPEFVYQKPAPGEIKTILIAEDDNINYLLMEKILALEDYKIIRAKNGEEAVTIFLNNKDIDLVLMDIKMPILSGYEAVKKIRKINTVIPIIAQTAYSSREEMEKILKSGFTDFITKPLHKEKLFELLHKYLN